MRNLYMCIVFCCIYVSTQAQCATGYNAVALNWDYLDFVVNSGSYSTFINLAQSQTQKFAFGTQGVTVTHNYSTANTFGEESTHTGDAGSFGAGDDVRFKGDGTVTFTFDQPVQNLKFSLYDVDRGQSVTIGALNGAAGTPVNLTTVAGTILSISNNNTATARVDASVTNAANNSSAGTVNITIAGDVTKVTLTISQTQTNGTEDGSFYISDLSACSVGTFPTNYYQVSKPFVNQPAYVLVTLDNKIFYVDVATGKAKLLFTDPAGNNINSTAYDPYNKVVYYTYSLTATPTADKTIYKYDYKTNTKSVFVANVNTLGIATYYPGVESGAAAYYDGSLYIGIEGAGQPSGASGSLRSGYTNRESAVWKINIDAGGNAVSAKQVYALPVDNGNGNGLHDWSDFGINDGILYDFDGATSDLGVYHENLLTGAVTEYLSPTFTPRQTSVDYTGKLYNVGSPNASAAGTIVPYNNNGTVNTAQQYNITYNGTTPVGSWGDAGEAFKPKTDFGDAPASYDPVTSDPATHEIISNLYIGNTVEIEFDKRTSSDASGDGAEEDGLVGIPVIGFGVSNYDLAVKVFNNTGAPATLAGWIDSNGDGVFQPGEGVTATVPSNAASQTINLHWIGINVIVPVGSNTFLRLRLTAASNGMTAANPTGYYPDGEVEDYPINVSLVLPDQYVTLDAQKTAAQKINLVWKVSQEQGYQSYELQKSRDGLNWTSINQRSASGSISAASYTFLDVAPLSPFTYYRVKATKATGAVTYTATRKIDIGIVNALMIAPNPANSYTTLNIQAESSSAAQIDIIDFSGRSVYNSKVKITAGANEIRLPVIQKLSDGIYKVRVTIDNQLLVTSLVVIK